jgi:hypothetical protein
MATFKIKYNRKNIKLKDSDKSLIQIEVYHKGKRQGLQLDMFLIV